MAVPSSDLPANLVPQSDLPAPSPAPTPAPVRTGAVPVDDLPSGLVPKDDLPTSTAPTPLSTPHTYDSDILEASKKYGLDPKILRQVGMQETGLGTSPNYDPKTGLDKDGNAGHGPWQLDPAHFGAKANLPENQAILKRAATDPAFAARYAAQDISGKLKEYNGNLRMALAAYNAGDPNSAAGQAYADHVLSAYSNLDPLSVQHPELQTKIVHTMKAANAAIGAGKNPLPAIIQGVGAQPAYNKWNDLRARWEWLKKHPLEGGIDILGAPQREIGGLMGAAAHDGGVQQAYHDWLSNSDKHKQMLREFSDVVWNPTDKNNARATQNVADFIDTETGHAVHVPSHEEIDKAIHNAVWQTPVKGMQGALQTGAKAGRDLALQFISDPLSLPGGLAEKALEGGGAVVRQLTRAMGPTAAAAFPHLTLAANKTGEMAQNLFGIRRDLDKAGFTRDGKRIRLAIENGELSKQAARTEQFGKIAGDNTAAANEYTQHMQASHLPVRPNDVAELLDPVTPKERRMEILEEANKEATQTGIRDKSVRLFAGNQNYYRGNAAALPRIGTHDPGAETNLPEAIRPITQGLRFVGKRAIMWNPFPHGLKNVGTLAYMAGGLPAVARGIAGMVTPVDAAKVLQLREMGALPHYLEEAATDPITHHANNALQHMEAAWRIGLMETFDRQLGKPTSEADKLMRGWLINDKIGDYRNVSAFVKFFEAMGGPFVAFRLGIVPKNMMAALAQHPERVVNAWRAKQDVQNNRAGRYQNTLEVGGPDVDWLKLVTDPQKFLENSEGQINAASVLGNLADAYIPGAQFLGDMYKAGMGVDRPNQRTPNLADALEDALMSVYLGSYFKKNEAPKYEMKDYREIREGKK